MVVGGLVYILFRDTGMLMFRWAAALSLTESIAQARHAAAPLLPWIPEAILYSLPDGAWVFSCTAFFARLWHDGPLWNRIAWIGLGPALAIGGELGQLIPGFIPGTFDPVDMLFYVAATVGALWVAARDLRLEGGFTTSEAQPATAR